MNPRPPRRATGAFIVLAILGLALAALMDLRAPPRAEAGESGVAYATIDGTETLTSKTLSSPTVVTPTMSGVITEATPPIVTSAKLTTGTAVMTSTGVAGGATVSRFDWTNAHVVAISGTTAGDLTVCTLPAKTEILDAFVVIDTPDTSTNALSVALGRTSAAYIDYVVASDAKGTANTVYGDASAERGSNLVGYDLPSYTTTTIVKLHFIKTSTNLSTVLGSTGHVILVTRLLP